MAASVELKPGEDISRHPPTSADIRRHQPRLASIVFASRALIMMNEVRPLSCCPRPGRLLAAARLKSTGPLRIESRSAGHSPAGFRC